MKRLKSKSVKEGGLSGANLGIWAPGGVLSCIFEKQNTSERSLSSHFQAIPLSQNWHEGKNDLTTNMQTQIRIH